LGFAALPCSKLTGMSRIVLIEDNEALRAATVSVLEDAGFPVWGLSCAEDLNEFSDITTADIYLLDLNLPGEDGLSLAKRLRKAQPQAGIIMITARTDIAQRIDGYKNGADMYLPKPVDPQELVAVVKALCARLGGGPARQAIIEMDTQSLTLQGPGGISKLTQRDCLIITGFARAVEQTLERWQLMGLIDPQDNGVSNASLEVQIGRIRKKIEHCLTAAKPESAPRTITAIRGHGYRLLVDIAIK